VRIVGGRYRGRRLTVPKGPDVRPTADRVRESLFNILAHGIVDVDLDGASVVDVFAGSGALGLEALSRGAARAVFIDQGDTCLQCIRRTAGEIGVADDVLMLRLDAARLPPPPLAAGDPAAVVFLDAPYGLDLTVPALAGLKDKGWIADDATCVVEIAADETLMPPPGFTILDERTYGAAKIMFLRGT
jgi:16S rRNA (guanine966-N2)-methyltransferase